MIKIFVTGDNHIGRQFVNSPVKRTLIESRIDSLIRMVNIAEKNECDYFVITGDLFDRVSNIAKSDIFQVVDILKEFSGTVLVLPGNHDYYTGSEVLWRDFISRAADFNNIILLNNYKPFSFECDSERVFFYPSYCDCKHSKSNKTKWIQKEEIMDQNAFHIGIAHGSLKGISPDLKNEYFQMKPEELDSLPIDAWLLGHTHITYPFDLEYNKDICGYKIFNPGTHEQLDFSNHTEGNALIVSLDKDDNVKHITVRKIKTGNIRYHAISCKVDSDRKGALRKALKSVLCKIDKLSIIKMTVAGTISEEEYKFRQDIYREVMSGFLDFTVFDDELVVNITPKKIRAEYSEVSLASKFLCSLEDDPIELQMAYNLIKTCEIQ